MRHNDSRAGYSLVEVMIVLAIIGLLLRTAPAAFAPMQARLASDAAQRHLHSLHAQARITAVQRGENVFLNVSEKGDSAWIATETQVLNVVRFQDEGVSLEVLTEDGNLSLCMTPRGIAEPRCNSFDGISGVYFLRGEETRLDLFLPLGQLLPIT